MSKKNSAIGFVADDGASSVEGSPSLSSTILLPELSVVTPNHSSKSSSTDSLFSENLKASLGGLPEFEGDKKNYWRSLEELADTPEFDEYVKREYPSQVEVLIDPVSRRNFLKLMGASFGLAGLAACTKQPKEEVIPYVRQPEQIVAGKALYFATAMPSSDGALGLLVRSNEGRPTKVEGNPDHPSSLGSTDIFAQAAILSLYDPDRSQTVTHLGDIRSWPEFQAAISSELDGLRARKGAGLRFLTENIYSPTVLEQLRGIATEFPSAQWHVFDAATNDGLNIQTTRVNYRFDKAKCILSLDSEFLTEGTRSVRFAKDFASTRRLEDTGGTMSRLYAIETSPRLTGANADHVWSVRPSEFGNVVSAIAAKIGVSLGSSSNAAIPGWIDALVQDLQSNRGASIVIAGMEHPLWVQNAVQQMNAALGNIGSTVFYNTIESTIPQHTLGELVRDIDAGQVDTLVIMGANPIYAAPQDLQLRSRIGKVRLVVHHGLHADETAEVAHWHVPEAHFLESWGDARSFDGTTSIIQPLIAPLYQGRTQSELLTVFTKQPERQAYDIVKEYWLRGSNSADAENKWRRAIHDGLLLNSTYPSSVTAPSQQSVVMPAPIQSTAEEFDVVFRLDPTVLDGRYSNNAWLQELPKPLTKLTWDAVAYISPKDAASLGVEADLGSRGKNYNADIIEVEVNGARQRFPVWVQPGQPEKTVTLFLGYGRTRAGRVGSHKGMNANVLRTSANPWFAYGAKIRKTGESYPLAATQVHFTMEGREIVRATTLEEFLKHPDFVHEKEQEPSKEMTMYPPYDYSKGYAWGMSIDLNSCIGCNACIVGCQSENNIPVVGKDQVMAGREMHWIRVDRYYTGAADAPETYFQPVPCMHCENAPCELVCPVGATVHSSEGLNDMVYNRCVGTRYCSNNCPYKVRRFNFLLYQDWNTPSLKLARNPEVSVRSRGVMEKCTYCVQRIQNAKIDSEKEDRAVRDGEIVTACEAACPTNAIVFGNINDPNSRVAKAKANSRTYSLLGELNTRPRTTYQGGVRNPNPKIIQEPHSA